jgi:CheY-like chemotaxis protein
MSEGSRGSVEAAPGIWRLSAALPFGGLEVNCYLLSREGQCCLVDAGPAALAQVLVPEAEAIAPVSSIGSIIALDDSPFAYSALKYWSLAGFRGEIVANWRVATALAMAGMGLVRDLWEEEPRLFEGTWLSMRVLRLERRAGAIALLHEATGVLFSGSVASSSGKDLPAVCSDPGLEGQRRYIASFGYDRIPSAQAGDPPIGSVCPRFGSTIPPGLARQALAVGEPGGQCTEPPDGISEIARELDALRSTNYGLKQSMIEATDAALRDSASGLYGRGYADAFLKELLRKGSGFSAAFIRIDRIKELNRRVGARTADAILKDLATRLLELEGESFLFRWTGPILLLILMGSREDIFGRLDRIRRTVASEVRFASPITVSIALVRSEELQGDLFGSLVSASRERLSLLDRRGGDAVLDRSDIRIEDKALILVLDSDPLFLDFLVEYLEREGFKTMGASRGGQALELMDRNKPELVICDLSLPQFDGFQIRSRMRSSSDLHDIPFILLSATKSDESIARAHSLAIYHFFTKPVSMVELVGIANSLLARSEDGA